MYKLSLLLVAGFLLSCEKENELKQFKQQIVGTWEMEKVVGYPFNQPAFPAGNGRMIVLGADGSFERKQHDTLLFSGIYLLKKKKDCYERSSDMILSTNETTSGTGQYVEVTDGKLVLSTPNCYQDGGNTYYRRVK